MLVIELGQHAKDDLGLVAELANHALEAVLDVLAPRVPPAAAALVEGLADGLGGDSDADELLHLLLERAAEVVAVVAADVPVEGDDRPLGELVVTGGPVGRLPQAGLPAEVPRAARGIQELVPAVEHSRRGEDAGADLNHLRLDVQAVVARGLVLAHVVLHLRLDVALAVVGSRGGDADHLSARGGILQELPALRGDVAHLQGEVHGLGRGAADDARELGVLESPLVVPLEVVDDGDFASGE